MHTIGIELDNGELIISFRDRKDLIKKLKAIAIECKEEAVFHQEIETEEARYNRDFERTHIRRAYEMPDMQK